MKPTHPDPATSPLVAKIRSDVAINRADERRLGLWSPYRQGRYDAFTKVLSLIDAAPVGDNDLVAALRVCARDLHTEATGPSWAYSEGRRDGGESVWNIVQSHAPNAEMLHPFRAHAEWSHP